MPAAYDFSWEKIANATFTKKGEARSSEKSVFIRIFSALRPVNCCFLLYATVTCRAPSVDFALRTGTFEFVREHEVRAGVKIVA